MEEEIIYRVHFSYKDRKIIDLNYAATMNGLIEKRSNFGTIFKVTVIDENNLTSKKIDVMVNHYIEELFKENGCFAIKGLGKHWNEIIEGFIVAAFEVVNQDVNKLLNDNKHLEFDVFCGKYYFSFITEKTDYIEKKHAEMLVMGPDYLMGTSFSRCKELVPSFFSYLYDIDGFENEKANQLQNYQIGLH